MSVSSSPLSFKTRYDIIIERLQSIIRDPEQGSNGRDIAIFLDDMLLRLKLWAADIQVNKGSLDWVEKIEPVATALRDLLHHLDREVQMFDACTKPLPDSDEEEVKVDKEVSKSKGELSEANKEGVLNAIENLTTYTTPIKAANSIPETERTNPKSQQINKSLSSQSIPRNPKGGTTPTYFILAHPLPGAMAERLLGALVLDIHDPQPIPKDGSQRSKILASWVHVYTEKNSSKCAEWIKSKSISSQVDFPISVAPTAAGASISASRSYESSSALRYDIGPIRITTHILNAPSSYMEWLFCEYQDHLGKKPRFSQTYYVVTGLKTAPFEKSSSDMIGVHETSQTLFAARYERLTIRNRLFSKKITQKTYGKGASF